MQTRIRNTCFLLCSLLGAATPALAEVMDKEPTVGTIWQSAFVLAVLVLGAGCLHPLLGLGLGLVLAPTSVPLGALSEIHSPFVGPAIRAEAGMGYVYHAYAANGMVFVSYLIGVALWVRQRQRSKRQAAR